MTKKPNRRARSAKNRIRKLIAAHPELADNSRELWVVYMTKFYDLALSKHQEFVLLDKDTPSMGTIDRTLRKVLVELDNEIS